MAQVGSAPHNRGETNMCQHHVTLAERSRTRYITQCEHGTVHMVWDGVGVHLPQKAFLYLADQVVKTLNEIEIRDDPTLRGHCRLQVGRITFCVPLDDFRPLAEMVTEALPKVGRLDGKQMQRLSRLTPHRLQHKLVLN
jgi:hypothetical protein